MVYAFGIEIPLIEILFALGVIGIIVLLEIIIVLAISAYQMKNVRELVEEMLVSSSSERSKEIKEELISHFGKKESKFKESLSSFGKGLSRFFYNAYVKIKHLFHIDCLFNFFRKEKKEKIEFDFDKKN